MPDNKSKRGAGDRSRVAGGQSYEVDHSARKLQKEFPNHSRQQVKRAIIDSAKVKQFHNNRTMVENSARLKLRNS